MDCIISPTTATRFISIFFLPFSLSLNYHIATSLVSTYFPLSNFSLENLKCISPLLTQSNTVLTWLLLQLLQSPRPCLEKLRAQLPSGTVHLREEVSCHIVTHAALWGAHHYLDEFFQALLANMHQLGCPQGESWWRKFSLYSYRSISTTRMTGRITVALTKSENKKSET